jgi:hypothetical protein
MDGVSQRHTAPRHPGTPAGGATPGIGVIGAYSSLL